MTLTEGQRVRLSAETRLIDSVAPADGSSTATAGITGSLSLAAGTEGAVERVVEHRHESEGVREYQRLASLLDAFGREMPAGSRRQLEEKVAALEPEWIAHQKRGLLVTVRVRFDNGFVLDDVDQGLFSPC
ncbi:hypothetical protein [Streptomyces sp. H27-S2]|uniref:hypothetical protein n=1 Tax=Streptomyces antarcticus TaxID=2996458 RepID=UPI00226DB501|nr:hypothetical protein [Streptomyces sp. H27-S2]MCY0954611.1 hypothetical protein [Streptomyces sp. H27-S2]